MIANDIFVLDPTAPGSLQARIRQMIAQGILSGRLRMGERLPSSRQLAAHLGVSRITVTLAYTALLADDYIISRGRSGYFVSHGAPTLPEASRAPVADTVDWPRILGPRFPGLALEARGDWASFRYNFIYGQPDPTLFDSANWRLCALQALGKRDFEALTADQFDGDDPQLVNFIARQTLPRRGIVAAPDEILLTLGAQNALWLTAQILLNPQRRAVIEDPCYPALRAILHHTGCPGNVVPVDRDGLDPTLLPEGTDVVFTTPGHQCPTTATLSSERRHALLGRAQKDDFLIVEDDYEFEIDSPDNAPALKSLDRNGRVIYVGSFSKSLFPGLRLGYLVGPAPFIAQARALRAVILRHPPGHIQRTVAYFLSLGHYDALIRRMGRAYDARRSAMSQALLAHDLTPASTPPPTGGSAFWLRAPAGTDTTEVATRLRQRGVLIEPGARFFADPRAGHAFYRLAYSSIQVEGIAEGIALVSQEMARGGAG